jgi:hypothetical protein
MEHEEKPLPLEHRMLGKYSLKNPAYAKALHYKELEYLAEASPATIKSLIFINGAAMTSDRWSARRPTRCRMRLRHMCVVMSAPLGFLIPSLDKQNISFVRPTSSAIGDPPSLSLFSS